VDLLARSQPKPDGCKLDEGKAVRCKLVVACRDPTTLLDPIEEPLDPVTGAIEIRAEGIAAIAFWRDVCPCAFLHDKLSDPIGVIATVCEQHRSGFQTRQEFAREPIVVGLAGAQGQPDRQAPVIYECMNLAGQTAP